MPCCERRQHRPRQLGQEQGAPHEQSFLPSPTVLVQSESLNSNTEFKFLVIDEKTGDVVAWEGGENRRLGITPDSKGASVVAGLRFINSLDLWRGAGTAIPVFALRSDDDMGVGDFYDLLPMIDWAQQTNQCISSSCSPSTTPP